MKPSVAISMVLAGAALIVVPPVMQHLNSSQVAGLLANAPTNSVYLEPAMSSVYAFGCWFTGSSMIGLAFWSSARNRERSAAPAPPMAHDPAVASVP